MGTAAFPVTTLPVELQRHCISFFDVQGLKNTRLASRVLLDVATEALFASVTLWPTEESAEKFKSVVECEALRRYVRRTIVYTDQDPEAEYHDESTKDILDSWRSAIERIPEFPNVRHMNLKFAIECSRPMHDHLHMDRKYVAEDLDFRTGVLNIVLAMLNSKPDIRVDTLSIKHLQDFTCNVYETKEFSAVRGKINRLHLQIATEIDDAAPEDSIEIPERHHFFNQDLNTQWLSPMQAQITHLTLYCNEYWGIYPRWDPSSIHFPNLKCLSLGNYTIAWDWQIEWILSHGSTLEELRLDNCPIAHALCMTERQFKNDYIRLGQRGPPTSRRRPPMEYIFPEMRWHTVLPLFCKHLKVLKCFAMGRGCWEFCDEEEDDRKAFEKRHLLTASIHHSRYAYFDQCWWREYDPERGMGRYARAWTLEKGTDRERRVELIYPDCDEEDERALQELLIGIGTKRGQ